MKVFKFGGASIKDSNGVRNVLSVLEAIGYEDTLIVMSAMGCVTDSLEKVVHNYFHDTKSLDSSISSLEEFHINLINELFDKDENFNKSTAIKIKSLFLGLHDFLKENKSSQYSYVYDQIVSLGEVFSTTIVSDFFNFKGINNTWLDIRKVLKTDDDYQQASVNWEQSALNVADCFKKGKLYITQGFIGSDSNGFSTTLGREGSDYTAALLAYFLSAKSVTIWKDVPGVLNADPRYFNDTKLLTKISYTEAVELAFYGASVIHPKTLQPLQNKQIPLFVKSFLKPDSQGTIVENGIGTEPKVPCFILKKNQILLSLSSNNFSFIAEDSITEIFRLLHNYKMQTNLIQSSATSFSICIQDKFENLNELLEQFYKKFKVTYYSGVSLYTIRHFEEDTINYFERNKKILLKQSTFETAQFIVEE